VGRLGDLSIRHRLTLVMTLTTGLALIVAGAGLLVFEAAQAYRSTGRDLASIAEMVGAHSGAALAFNDRTAAQKTLDTLRSRPEIVCAGLYDAGSQPFAGYGYSGTADSLPAVPGDDRLAFEEHSLLLVAPVFLEGERTGTVYVRASLVPLAAKLRGYGLTVLLMTLAAMASAVPISRRLQHSVSRPILQLAETAQAVTRDGNYSLRAPRLGTDELGILTEDFNTMLARIEGQDAELRLARDELGLWLAAQNEDLRYESSERRRAEGLNQRLMLAVQSSREMISIADPDDRLVFVNRAFLEAYGLTEEEVIGRHVEPIYSPNNPKGLRRKIAEETRRGGWQGELLNCRKDGSEFPISLSTSVVRDDQGQVVGLLGVARDISEQRARETWLHLQEAALAATVDAVVITDRDGTIEWVNPAFTRLTGYSPEEAVGRKPSILKSGAQPPAFYRELWDTLLAGRVWYGELSNRRKDGSLYTEEMTITPVTDEAGRIAHFAAIKRDISDRLALESRLHGARRMEALGQLAGGVAHDFNNLLGVIRGSGELLLAQMPAPDPRREKLEQILDASRRAANLTHQLLAFGRRQVLAPRVVDLNAVVAETEIYLPRVEQALEPLVQAPPPPARRTPATILLVEDEASLREIAQELLEASGYTVLTAANGAEALAVAEQQTSDSIQLLLTDVVMPGMSGPALAQTIRARWPDVSVVFMSGYSREAVQKHGLLEAGARLLAKPFSLNTLVRSVEEALAGRTEPGGLCEPRVCEATEVVG
jgi:PAS domain S-box-containing protein